MGSSAYTSDNGTSSPLFPFSDVISQVCMDGSYACVALQSHYVMYNVAAGSSQDLFPFEDAPVIARVAKEEFLGRTGGPESLERNCRALKKSADSTLIGRVQERPSGALIT